MENTILAGLVDAFGKSLAMRIYACAIIMLDTSEKVETMEDAVRYTIGALKRTRRQGGRKSYSYEQAVTMLEDEQSEGRHYSVPNYTPTTMEIRRIEAINALEEGEELKVSKYDPAKREEARARKAKVESYAVMACVAEYEEKEENANPERLALIKDYVAHYVDGLTSKRRAFVQSVVDMVRKGFTPDRSAMRNLSNRYVPDNFTPTEFVELLARYV